MKRYVLGVLGLLAGCSFAPDESVRATGRPIINGELDTNPDHLAVVSLSTPGGFSFCSGTYIGNRTIISAGHCLEGASPNSFLIYFGNKPSTDRQLCNSGNQVACSRFVEVEELATFGFNPGTLKNDMSVIRMVDEPAVGGVPVTPIRMVSFIEGTELTQEDEGEPISFAGFGVTDGDAQSGGGTRMVVNPNFRNAPQGIELQSVGPDGAFGLDINQVRYEQPDAGGGPCNGDSGGPMFVRRNGIEFVAATTSFGDQGCHIFGVSTRTDTFEAQICAFAGADALGCGGNPLVPELCNNGQDDDGDSFVDCQDSQCGNDPVCRETVCDNGIDDNGNGLIDCDDSTCSANPACAEVCDNDQDDDNDGNIDCQDGDCIGTSACRELCDNGQDDDGDGKVDCQDVADCATNAACLAQVEGDCDDFSDNDQDGQTDCADADCAASPACEEAPAPPAEGCAVQPASSHGALAALFSLLSLAAFFARRRRF